MNDVRTLGKAAAICLCVWLPTGQSHAAEDWQWTITPYLWASDIGMEVTVRGDEVLDTEIAFGDLLDKVDFALSAHFEGQRGKGGFLTDLTYIDLGSTMTVSGTAGPPAPPDGTVVDTDLRLVVFEGGGFYRPQGGKTGLDMLLGVRYISMDQGFDIAVPAPLEVQTTVESSSSLTDAFVGLRYSGRLTKKWGYQIRGDVGAGGTDLTLNGIAAFTYQFGKTGKYSLGLGYRYMNIEIEEKKEGVTTKTDLTMSGAFAGFMITW